MSLIRSKWVISILAWHVIHAWFVRLFSRDPLALRAFFLKRVSAHSRWIQKALRINVKIDGLENIHPGQNYLIVANHMSYLDAILVAGFRECAFVTSMEMRALPVLGLITELGGCLYVERRNKDNIQNEISGIEEALGQGFNVVVFPEATSTDGAKILPFKRPLFAAAVKTGKPVLPVVIQYETIDGEPVTAKNRDHLCWYGDMSFAPHVFGLTRFSEIGMRLKVLPEIRVTEESTRDTLMEAAFAAVSKNYKPIQ